MRLTAVFKIYTDVRMTQVDEWTPLVMAKLREELKDRADLFLTALKKAGGLIAGGFVLQSILQYPTTEYQHTDIDIYVSNSKVKQFLDDVVSTVLIDRKIKSFGTIESSVYCRSFLRRNHIRRIHRLIEPASRGGFGESIAYDVMAIRNNHTP